jgi:hypothetical protein
VMLVRLADRHHRHDEDRHVGRHQLDRARHDPALIAASTLTGRCGPCCSTAATGWWRRSGPSAGWRSRGSWWSHHQCDLRKEVKGRSPSWPPARAARPWRSCR